MYQGQKVIDVHGHMTTPDSFRNFGMTLMTLRSPGRQVYKVSDDELRESLVEHIEALDKRQIDYQLGEPGALVLPNGPSWQNLDWTANKGTWLVYTLPQMEQENLFKEIPNLLVPHFDSMGAAEQAGVLPTLLPYGRCPSDGWKSEEPTSNYVGNMGPECLDNFCNFEPYQQFCNMPQWGWTTSAEAWRANVNSPRHSPHRWRRSRNRERLRALPHGAPRGSPDPRAGWRRLRRRSGLAR